jgi:alginate O-acetyltransferase complex protein AlgI
MLGYSYQLYFDFSGYSNMAVGLGFLFGMHIPQNFNSPYRALNPADVWRRWHISLSRGMRDYLYIPLGGSRAGEWLTYRNLTITMLIGGLWHGAAWTFVIWGAYHGLLLILYRRFSAPWDALPVWAQRAGMFLLALVGWTMFRAPNWSEAVTLMTRLFVPHDGAAITGAGVLIGMLVIAGFLAHFGRNAFELSHRWTRRGAFALALLLVFCLVRIYGAESSPFLYFQF